jgi:putative GTP pyrophosphokinase
MIEDPIQNPIQKIDEILIKNRDDLFFLLREMLIVLKQIDSQQSKKREQLIIEKPSFRIKKSDSIIEKISRKGITIDNFITEFKDVLGIRVICLDLSSLDLVCQFLQSSPKITILNTKRWIETADQDGYRGIHLIFTLNDKSHLNNPDIKGELQIRTVAQHCWASFSHRDLYKADRLIFANTSERIRELSDTLYRSEKEVQRLASEIKTNPLSVNPISLNSLFLHFNQHFTLDEIERFYELLCQFNYDHVDIPGVQAALTLDKNSINVDITNVEDWIQSVFMIIEERDPHRLEEFFCRIVAYYKGGFWPKRRVFEIILQNFKEKWVKILGIEDSKTLVLLLEAAQSEFVERYIFTWQSDDNATMTWSPLIDNRYTVKNLLDNQLIDAQFINNIEQKKGNTGILSKCGYIIKCTEKGKTVASLCCIDIFKSESKMNSLLDNLEHEDYPAGEKWYYNEATVEYSVKHADPGPQFIENSWWSNTPDYY